MATYGAREENRFKLNGVTYYPLVDSVTGKITLKSPLVTGDITQSADQDRTVGTIEASGSNAKKFQPVPGSTTTGEEEFFSKPENVSKVRGQAQKTAFKAQVAQGVTGPVAQARANELLNTGTTTTPPVKVDPESSNSQFTLEDATTGINNLQELSISSAEIRTNYYNAGQPLKYPIDFPENQDRIKFTMYRYAPKKIGIGENLGTFSGSNIATKDNQKEIFGSVFLPISPTISDQNTVNWGGDEMNALQALAAAASYGTIKDGVMGAIQSAGDVAKGLQNASPELKAAAAAYFAGEAAGGNKTFFSRVTGAVLNPNFELLFNGPQLRTFSFSFTLSAREEKESKEIRKIIRFFKQGMAVQRAKTNLFLKAPNIFDISYQLSETNEDHPWMNKIKTCALTNCNVNYTPAGNYATFYDGAMTAYELTLSFSEIDPIFEDDYTELDNNKDTMIGY